MNTLILAISDKYALSGVWCLVSIPILIIALWAFRGGIIAGIGINATLCIICIFCFAEPEAGSSGGIAGNIVGNNAGSWITNESQTKWIRKPSDGELDEPTAIFMILNHKMFFIPAEETNIDKDGCIVMKITGEIPIDGDYYLYDERIPSINVPSKAGGGGGIPQWLWHPAASIYIFGFFGLPVLLGSIFISNKMF